MASPLFAGGSDPAVYEVPDDVYETLPDGRVIQIAVKGTALPLGEAQKLGLIKMDVKTTPAETKETWTVGKAPVADDPPPTPAGAERAPAAEPAEDAGKGKSK